MELCNFKYSPHRPCSMSEWRKRKISSSFISLHRVPYITRGILWLLTSKIYVLRPCCRWFDSSDSYRVHVEGFLEHLTIQMKFSCVWSSPINVSLSIVLTTKPEKWPRNNSRGSINDWSENGNLISMGI